ncbi:MAG: sigma-70 family RNA polymerase sigma factor [Bdellovibrionales bacterium]|nr:sigma-70 family RNA polymerase sigma factor [Bdellovibrionales bacterium]
MSSLKTDEQLVEDFLCGNHASFEILISRYSEKAFSLASRMCRNQEDAEEVLQDVFVTVFRKLRNFEGKSTFSSWLYRITVNAALMKLRKRRQEKTQPIETSSAGDEGHTLILQTEECDLGDELTLRSEVSQVLEEAIRSLPEEYRPVFVLRDVDGLTSKEVGKILGLSIPAVKSRLHRSRMMLRRKLSKFYTEFSSGEQTKSVGNL